MKNLLIFDVETALKTGGGGSAALSATIFFDSILLELLVLKIK